MKSLLEFKIESLVGNPEEGWIDFFNRLIFLLSGWEISEEYLDSFHFRCDDVVNYEPKFIQEFVYYALGIRGNPLWKGAFEVRKFVDNGSYYDYTRYDMILRSWKDIEKNLDTTSGTWVFNNYEKVKEFKGQAGSEIYNKLKKIKDLFSFDKFSKIEER